MERPELDRDFIREVEILNAQLKLIVDRLIMQSKDPASPYADGTFEGAMRHIDATRNRCVEHDDEHRHDPDYIQAWDILKIAERVIKTLFEDEIARQRQINKEW